MTDRRNVGKDFVYGLFSISQLSIGTQNGRSVRSQISFHILPIFQISLHIHLRLKEGCRMRVVVTFPIYGKHRMEATWPIEVGDRRFGLSVEDGFVKSVCVTFAGIDTVEAPTITGGRAEAGPPTINIGGNFLLRAERDIRAWQAILAPYINLSIGFDDSTIEYVAETANEERNIVLSKFSAKKVMPSFRGRDEYSIYGRAFLAIEYGYNHIEKMHFYIEGMKYLEVGRPIDAYNNFYLWFESNYSIPSRTNNAVNTLLKNDSFISALVHAARDAELRISSSSQYLKELGNIPLNLSQLIKEIVELRGCLRHHSLSNPARWDPANQGRFVKEAQFLAAVAFQIAFPETAGRTWSTEYINEFNRQTEELGCMTEVHAILTFKEEDHTSEAVLNLKFPTITAGASLAKAVLERALDKLNEKSPGAELYGIRSRIMPHGSELFRYDLGPSISR